MAIEKLSEFAKDGQKNTDDLVLTDGFSVSRKPARQWFNYLFNMLSLKINEIIELDPVARSEIADNLTTDDANKVASARTVKELQDKKLEAADLKDASTSQKGIVKLNNTLTSTSVTEALTAAQGSVLNNKIIGVGQTWQNVRSERSVGVTYTNTTGKPIQLNINSIGAGQIWFVLNGENFAFLGQGASEGGGVTPIILPGDTYKLSTGSIQSWWELR